MSDINQFGQNTWGPMYRQDTFVPDQLIAGPLQLVTDNITVAAGRKYVRGTVLGLIAASGKYTLSKKSASDGSENPSVILVDNIDATPGDVRAGAYLMGEFNMHRITADTSWTPEALRTEMRKYSLFLKDANTAPLTPEIASS